MLLFSEVNSAFTQYKFAAANGSMGGDEFFIAFLSMDCDSTFSDVIEFTSSPFMGEMVVDCIDDDENEVDTAAEVLAVVVVVADTTVLAAVFTLDTGVLVLAKRPFLFTSANSGFTLFVSLLPLLKLSQILSLTPSPVELE